LLLTSRDGDGLAMALRNCCRCVAAMARMIMHRARLLEVKADALPKTDDDLSMTKVIDFSSI
jgi:hypothetical protein